MRFANFLVDVFQDRLGCPRDEAKGRATKSVVLVLLILGVGLIGLWILPTYIVPKTAWTGTTHVNLLSGNHIVVEEILDGDALVKSRDQFEDLSASGQTIVAKDDYKITYLVKGEGIGYRYQIDAYGHGDDITDQQLQTGGKVSWDEEGLPTRSATFYLALMILLVLGVMLLLGPFIRIEEKPDGQSTVRFLLGLG